MSVHNKIGDGQKPELFDWRAAARLTETNPEPIDQALTFTGLAAQIRECTESVGRML